MGRFGRLRLRSNKPRRLVLGIHPLPTLVTLGNLLCGFGSIILAMRAYNPPANFPNLAMPYDCLYWSGLLIFAAMVFDVLDGKVARWTKSASKFGMEMDSLCDVVSFGVAPAVLVKALIDQQLVMHESYPMLDRYIWSMLAVYVSCAALRLARYNVEAETGHRDFFFGMPSPGAAGCVASLAVLISRQRTSFGQNQETLLDLSRYLHGPVLAAFPFIMLGLGILMVTRVHYPHVGDRLLRGRKSFLFILLLGIALIITLLHHEVALTLAFNGYMLFGLLKELWITIFPSMRPAAWNEDVPPAPPVANESAPASASNTVPAPSQQAPAVPAAAAQPAPPAEPEPQKTETYRI
jgi:CDP-diacylglycerol--serine O-phosphatidyltransferase